MKKIYLLISEEYFYNKIIYFYEDVFDFQQFCGDLYNRTIFL